MIDNSSIFINMNFYLTITSVLLGIFSFIEYLQKRTAEKALKSITWEDMRNASMKIARTLIKKFQPNVILIPNIKSGIMLQFIKNYFKEYIPIIVGQTMSKEYFSKEDCNNIKGIENYWYIETQKWYVFIPNILQEYIDQKILILDNLSLTGNFLNIVTNELINHGIPRENIATACIATTEAAIADNMAPQYYYKTLPDSKTVYLPWGH